MKQTQKVILMAAMSVVGTTVFAQQFTTNSLIVKYRAGANRVFIKTPILATTERDIPQLNAERLIIPSGVSMVNALASLRRNPDVIYAEREALYKLFATPNDPRLPEQYGITQLNMPQAWDISTGRSNTICAVIDTGLLLTHEEFVGKIAPGGFDFSDNDKDPSDSDSHGTHCAGDAVASTNNGVGVASPSYRGQILPIKIFPNSFATNSAAAIMHAADNGARVISMSYGGPFPSQLVQDAINYAWNKGVVLFAASGNAGDTVKNYPAASDNVISVGATDPSGRRAGFSTHGDWVQIAAPGEGILSTISSGNSDYARFTGTSMACPMAAGVATLMIGRKPGITNRDVRDILFRTAVNIGPDFIKGRIDANAAVRQIPIGAPIKAEVTDTKVYVSSVSEGSGEGSFSSSSAASASLRQTDSSMFGVRSISTRALGHLSSTEATVTMPTFTGTLFDMKFDITAMSTIKASMLIMAQNVASGKFEQIGAIALGTTSTTRTLPISVSRLNTYMGSDNKIRLVFRTIAPSRSARPFTVRMDSVTLYGTVEELIP
jgi:thermitase